MCSYCQRHGGIEYRFTARCRNSVGFGPFIQQAVLTTTLSRGAHILEFSTSPTAPDGFNNGDKLIVDFDMDMMSGINASNWPTYLDFNPHIPQDAFF